MLAASIDSTFLTGGIVSSSLADAKVSTSSAGSPFSQVAVSTVASFSVTVASVSVSAVAISCVLAASIDSTFLTGGIVSSSLADARVSTLSAGSLFSFSRVAVSAAASFSITVSPAPMCSSVGSLLSFDNVGCSSRKLLPFSCGNLKSILRSKTFIAVKSQGWTPFSEFKVFVVYATSNSSLCLPSSVDGNEKCCALAVAEAAVTKSAGIFWSR